MKTDLLEEARQEFLKSSVDHLNLPEAPLISRLTLALDFGFGISDPHAILDFGFHNVFDVISPISATVWRYDSTEGWKMLGSVGKEISISSDSHSWDQVNQAAVLLRRPSVVNSASDDSKSETRSHWTIPVILPARSCYVLHVIAESISNQDNFHRIELLETFLQSFTYLVAQCDLTTENHDSNCEVDGQKILDARLTDRQEEIMQFVSVDLTYEQIAARMGFSQSTIKQEAMKIFKKLAVSNRADAVQKISSIVPSFKIHDRSLNG